MTVQVHLYWDTANLSGSTYTTNTPEIPDNYALEFVNGAVLVTSAWGGSRTVASVPNWNSKIEDSTWDGTIPTNPSQFRVCMEMEYTDTQRDYALIFWYDSANYMWIGPFSGYAGARAVWGSTSGDSDCQLAYAVVADTPFKVEVIVDTNNATANQRVRARAWAVGGSAPAFTDATTSNGSAGTMAADFGVFRLGVGGNETQNLRIGRVVVSDDITEDLSTYGESSSHTLEPVKGGLTLNGKVAWINPQMLRPASTTAIGSWTATGAASLYGALSEATPSDSEYITSATNPTDDTCEVALGTGTDPDTSDGHCVRYRIKATGTQNLTVQLREGASTTIAEFTHTPAPTDWTTYVQWLTTAQANSITDYTALRLKFIAP